MSECEVTEKSERFVVNVYNSLGRTLNKYIRVSVPDKSTSHQVFDSKGTYRRILYYLFSVLRVNSKIGNPIAWQIVPISASVKKLPGRKSTSTDNFFFAAGAWLPTLLKWQGSSTSHELVFLAADLPPFGIKSFYVQFTLSGGFNSTIQNENLNGWKTNASSGDHIISNEVFYKIALFLII